MKSTDKIKQYMDDATVRINPEMDEKVLGNILAVHQNATKTEPGLNQPGIWRMIMKSKMTKYAAAAVVMIGIIVGASVFNVSPDGATIAWAEMIEAMKAQQWIHAVIDYDDKDKGVDSQMWISVDPMIIVMQAEGNEISYFDFAKKIYQKYNYVENTVTIDRMEGVIPEGLDRMSPVDFMEMIIKDIQQGQNEIASSLAMRNGKEVEVITGRGADKTSTIIKDVQSGLIISGSTESSKEGLLTFEFKYPQNGPADIFALGIPQDAQIIDNRPTGDVKELADILNKKCEEGFGDYQAIALTSSVEKDNTLKPKMLVLMQEKGKLKRLDRYIAFDTTGRETKSQTIYPEIKDIWPDLGIEEVLAIDNAPARIGQVIFDGKKTMTIGPDGKVDPRQTVRMDILSMSQELSPALAWRSPSQMMRCPDNINMVMEKVEMDKEHIGLVGLRVRTTVKETLWQPKNTFSPRAGIRDFWFDPAKDYILVEEVAIYEKASRPSPYPDYSRTVVLKFAKTDKGQWYPSVIQTFSGKSADDPEMRIRQQNIVIDTSPVFKPGTFTVETMLQDK